MTYANNYNFWVLFSNLDNNSYPGIANRDIRCSPAYILVNDPNKSQVLFKDEINKICSKFRSLFILFLF